MQTGYENKKNDTGSVIICQQNSLLYIIVYFFSLMHLRNRYKQRRKR